MNRYFMVLIGLMCSLNASFANTNDALKAYAEEGMRQTATTSSATIETLKVASNQNQSEHKTLIDTLMQNATKGLSVRQKPQGADGAILFVSFSMPDALLFSLSDEAARFHIPVVLNGLVDADFKKTIQTFTRLNQEAKKQHFNFQGVSIDPVWFSQFHIKSVPALVVTEKLKACDSESSCTHQPYDVVYGNAGIKKSLELIAKKGTAARLRAQTILESSHV